MLKFRYIMYVIYLSLTINVLCSILYPLFYWLTHQKLTLIFMEKLQNLFKYSLNKVNNFSFRKISVLKMCCIFLFP